MRQRVFLMSIVFLTPLTLAVFDKTSTKSCLFTITRPELNGNGDILTDDLCAQDILPIGSSYDLDGNRIKEIKKSYHHEGITYLDFEEQSSDEQKERFFQNFFFQKISNFALHQLGPVAVRTLLHPTKSYVYDIYDLDGHLLVKSLNSGASPIHIFDTSEKKLIGKLVGLEQLTLTRNILEKRLYKPEMEALLNAGFKLGSDEDNYYLWIAELAD